MTNKCPGSRIYLVNVAPYLAPYIDIF